MICEKCNNQIDDDSKFCSFCGYKIGKKSEEVEIYKSEGNISNNIKKDLLSKDEELEINTNSKLKSSFTFSMMKSCLSCSFEK